MSDGHPFAIKDGAISRAAENAMLRLAARWMMVAGLPVMLAVIGWGGREIVAATNQNTLATVRLEGKLDGLQGTIDGTTRLLNSRIDAHADRLKSLDDRNTQQDTRMDRQDNRIDAIQQRVWRLPETRTP